MQICGQYVSSQLGCGTIYQTNHSEMGDGEMTQIQELRGISKRTSTEFERETSNCFGSERDVKREPVASLNYL